MSTAYVFSPTENRHRRPLTCSTTLARVRTAPLLLCVLLTSM